MTATQIYQLLQEYPQGLTNRQLQKKLGHTRVSIVREISALRESGVRVYSKPIRNSPRLIYYLPETPRVPPMFCIYCETEILLDPASKWKQPGFVHKNEAINEYCNDALIIPNRDRLIPRED